MIEGSWWHPVADAATPGAGPLAVTLLGHDLALWRGAGGAWSAFADRCPHRGTRLSLGRVCDAHLECAYHGWQFAADGACVRIPAVPQFEPGVSHRAAAYPVALEGGLVWVRLAAEGAAAPPRFPAESETRLRKLLVGPYDVATSAPRIVENFLDLAHFGFVHDGGLGERAHAEVPPYEVSVGPDGVRATGCQAWQPRSNRLSGAGQWVAYDYAVPAPYSAVLSKAPAQQDGYRESIALFVCPVEPERSRVWFRMAIADFDSSDADLRAFQHAIFMQDRPILESQTPQRLPLAGVEAHSAADRSSAAYRRWLGDLKIGFGVL
jgi:phenylpropionate dioxygenase-like ring-hydroxylating dioxygenase large terminal subunit